MSKKEGANQNMNAYCADLMKFYYLYPLWMRGFQNSANSRSSMNKLQIVVENLAMQWHIVINIFIIYWFARKWMYNDRTKELCNNNTDALR